jgi:hypothetical protein
MSRTIHGKAHGNMIELDEDLGVSDGQAVEVQITVIGPSPQRSGRGFASTEGALADDEEWDAIMEEIQRARKQERRPEAPDLE